MSECKADVSESILSGGSPSPGCSVVTASISLPSLLQPRLSVLHLRLCLSSISFLMSTSLIRLTWENCCLAAISRLSDRSSTPSLLFCSPVTCDSNTLDLLPSTTTTTTRPLSNPPGELGRAPACHWSDMTHTVMRHKEISLRGSRATPYSVFQNALFRCNPLSDFQVRRVECDRAHIELNFKIARETPIFTCSDTDLCSEHIAGWRKQSTM